MKIYAQLVTCKDDQKRGNQCWLELSVKEMSRKANGGDRESIRRERN